MKELGKISDFCEVIAGQSPDGKAYNTDGKGIEFHQGKKAFGIKILEESGVWTTTITKLAEAGDILMSVRAPVGPTNITNRKVCIGRGLAAIRCGENILPSFVLYALKNIEKKIIGNDGAVFNSINKKMIENIPIPIANINEQRRIVSYLDSSFKLIDEIKNKALKSLTEAKALFQSALAEAMEPKEGWEYKKLIDICDFQGGSQPPKSEWIDHESSGYVRMLQIRDFTQSRKVSPEYVKLTNRTKCCFSDDILIGRYGASLGKILTGIAGAYNVAIMRTIPNETILSKGYLKYYLMSSIFQSFLLNIGGRAAQAGFNKEDLKCLNIPLTTLDEQSQIVSHLDKLSSKVRDIEEKYQKMVEECDALKQAMLRDVFE